MPVSLDTNLNQAPYFSDYDPSKQYYHIPFKPGTAVQTRELNNLQSALYNQVARVGENLFVPGTIISGCSISTNPGVPYVKVTDSYANGNPLYPVDLVGNYVQSNSGLRAIVTNGASGLVSLTPNLNTLYIAYLNSAVNTSTGAAIKVFQNDEPLTVYDASNVSIGQITVANTASSGASNTTGYGYLFGVDNGVIFQKGMMLDVKAQSIFIAPYSNVPNNLSVGFTSLETIVTSYQDETLLDNAQGAPNQYAPGADRLKIVPTLTVVDSVNTTRASNVSNFFSICDFVNGAPSVVNQNTVYATIGDKMAEISSDTNGDFIINPFNIRTLQLVQNGVSNSTYMRLEIDPGSAYVDGYKVKLVGQMLGSLKKGTDTKQVDSGIISYSMGDYVALNEVAGIFDPTALQLVNLKNTAQYAVSNALAKGISPDTLSAVGTTIGTAYLYAFSFQNGTSSQANATYNAYLFNVNLNVGHSFAEVRSITGATGGHNGFGDIILQNGAAVLQNPNYPAKIFPFNQHGVKSLVTAGNTTDTQFQFLQRTPVTFSTTGNATITIPSYAGGTNQLTFGAGTLDTPSMQSMMLICQSNVHTANLAGQVTATSTSNVITGTSTSLNTSAFLKTGSFITLANSTATETRQVAGIVNSTYMTTTAPFSSNWTLANSYVSYMSGDIIPLAAANCSVSVANSTTMTIAFPAGLSASMSAQLLYPILRTNAKPALKNLLTKVYVNINVGNNAADPNGPWQLGIADVVAINKVWFGSSFSTANPTCPTSLFTLDNGQRDSAYKHASITPQRGVFNTSQKLTFELQAYFPTPGTGAGFFSVDSYPVDDTGVTANSIYTQQIPFYTATDGTVYDLRNCMDFRMFTQNSIPYVTDFTAAVANTQIINPVNQDSFIDIGLFPPIPDKIVETSYQYYMGRYDVVGMTPSTNIIINAGVPSENPIPPGSVKGGMTLATVYIPPYPSLTPDIANTSGNHFAATTSITYKPNKRYTMADVGKIDERLHQVEYYTSLSVLEQSAQNLLLTNLAGTTRFQNGILVDPMGDFAIANTKDPAFNIAIDSANSVARPVFTQQLVDLKVASLANTVQAGRNVMLTYGEIYPPIVSQPFASNERSCSQFRLFVWDGKLTLNPIGDYQPDVTINPPTIVNLDSFSNWTNLPDAWGTQWGTWNESGSSVSTQQSTQVSGSTSTTTTATTTSVTSTQVGSSISVSPTYNSFVLGRVVTGLSIQPYARSNYVKYEAHGMRPSTQLYLYVNDKLLDTYGSMIQYSDNTYTTPIGQTGTLLTDAAGNIYGEFRIPGHTFFTGTLNVQLMDIANTTISKDVITTIASCQYFADNLSYTKTPLRLNTIEPQLSFNTISRSQTVNNTITSTNTVTTVVNNTVYYVPNNQPYVQPNGFRTWGGGGPGPDPIGQSFSVPSNIIQAGIEGIYLNSLDFFFHRKDTAAGITIHLQPMANGTVEDVIIPNSRVRLTPDQVNISSDSSVKTHVVFPAPVFIESDQYYVFVITPDGSNPNYYIWTATISGNDILTATPIHTFSTLGDMFLSSQTFTWTAYGNENIKFNAYAAFFNTASGSVTFTNKDYEYFNMAYHIKGFLLGETVSFGNTVVGAGATVCNTSTLVVKVPDTTGLSAGMNVGIFSNASQNSYIQQIQGVINSTAVIMNSYAPFNETVATMVLLNNQRGKVAYANQTTLVIENAGANSTSYLPTNNYIFSGYFQSYSTISTGSYGYGSLYDVTLDTICPKFSDSIPAECTIQYTMKTYSNTYAPDAVWHPVTPGLNIDFLDYERCVASRSNECRYLAGAKTLTINAAMTSSTFWLTPTIDTAKIGAYTVHNTVNDEDASNTIFLSEISNMGNAINRYISSTVTLASDVDAEDLTVYVGAYYPPGTHIYVYSKIENRYDIDPFDSKSWTPMYTTNTIRSSPVNTQDYNEYVYTFPTSNTANLTAFLDAANNNVVGYHTANGQLFESYNQFAIKIVLLSNNSPVVPMVTDFRAVSSVSNV